MRIGILGGLGPETSCKFCLDLNQDMIQITKCQPNIVMENLPVSQKLERKIVSGIVDLEMKTLLSNGVKDLNNSGADFIVIPCNTVHVFLDNLRTNSAIPILSIMEETAKVCMSNNFSSVGLLATQTTIDQKLHHNELSKFGIRIISPKDQDLVNDVILKILSGSQTNEDKDALLNEIIEMENLGASAIILGCTDLGHLINESDVNLPIIDTLNVLREATVRRCLS